MPAKRLNLRSPVLYNIEVTSKHREEAIRNSSNHCMIADAIRDAYPKFSHIAVDLQTIRFSDAEKGVRFIYLTPRICQVALVLFDEGKKNKEFSFNLRGAHTVAMNQINRQKGRPIRERIHLGRRRIIPGSPVAQKDGSGPVPETIGGRAPPRHPSSAGIRRFGMRAFTKEDIEETKAIE